ncbi:isochorismate synthase [Haliangium ochraceum]|uniref:isochorismate synthase n=1 Tax=Haliangium ochraceum (strain DSM 14365 / JCM 11303 / SMP-2) TaxID=502025 RepID=D0LH48_HALO1|nr:isochorismate synthase [Haliangium ochraceum]ACY18193.1 isochorismate synthase [Haliangium ochraceum DSM 14365]
MNLPLARDRLGTSSPVDFLLQALSAQRGQGSLTVVTVPAPVAPLERLLRCAEGQPAVLWDPPQGPGFCGFGQADELRAQGPERIAEVQERAAALFARVHHLRHPEVSGEVAPRLFGGFAFATGAADVAPWQGFGDARFLLPTWCYGREGDSAWLSVAVAAPAFGPDATGDEHAAEAAGPAEAVAAELQRLLAFLGQASDDVPAQPNASTRPSITESAGLGRDAWCRAIDDIRAEIEAGRYQKIVAARRSEIAVEHAIEPAAVLTRLGARYPGCYRFAVIAGGVGFVGATPERLVARSGKRVRTQALAGTIAAPGGRADAIPQAPGEIERRAAAALLASGKDRGEQALVVDAIARVLEPLCAELFVPDQPEIRALPHVLHLETPIAGVLRQPTHVLALVAALHPTPAVGGVPTAAAQRWICEREAEPRGWYAAPVGWFDEHGNGEFAVAIRSGLLAGHRAYLYAGAGIVRDSDPEAEFEETRIKLKTVLDALGVAS